MGKLWFKAKKYGWGWYPASLEGWFVTLFFIGLILVNAFSIDSDFSFNKALIHLLFPNFILVITLIVICYLKGEKPRWRWG